ncbi:MAG TPA: putative glycoside hydrolase [Gaiellaceae bacterium]|nr:putative glycoside hydrolase [Gaiellaceae bacterium]
MRDELDRSERLRERRRAMRRRRRRRQVALVAVLALAAASVGVGARFLTPGESSSRPGSESKSERAGKANREPRPLPYEMRGVHVTMALASLPGRLNRYFALTKSGLNTIQLDVKDENGEVAFSSPRIALAHEVGAARTYYRPRPVARRAHARGLYLIGRVVTFQDPILSAGRSGMAIRTRGGGVWTTPAGLGWANPYDRRVWKYNVDIAEAAVRSGFDEIMFDYVRFPSDGDVDAAVYKGRKPGPRSATIARFLAYAGKRLRPLGARISAAVFGLSATRELGIGQATRRVAPHLDVIYPMVYPSHYGAGELGLDDPNALPGWTVARALRDFRRKLRGSDTRLIPWLQDFSLGRTYGLEDVEAQVDAARDAATGGFLLWNPSGVYNEDALKAE